MPPRARNDRASPAASIVFQPDATEGSVRLADGQRVLAITEPLMQSLHFAVIERLGETAQDALYRTGYEWALQGLLRLNQDIHVEMGGANFDLWKLDRKFVLQRWWAGLEGLGWGTAAFDLHAAARHLTFVELRQSIVADAFAGADQPVCHLYAGLFAGALSFFDRTERHAVEVQCSAMGHAACKFVVGPGPEVDSAEAWRQQGTPAPEILRRLG